MQDVRHDPSPDAPFLWLMHSLVGAIECCVEQNPCMNETEYAVVLQVTAIRDTQEALLMLQQRKLNKRHKMVRTLLRTFLDKMRDNTLMKTWDKGLVPNGDNIVRVATDTTRFLTALNLISNRGTPLTAIRSTIGSYKNGKELH